MLFYLQKIKAVYDSNPEKFKTLQQILEAEKEIHGAKWPKVGATLALMWLKRFEKLYISGFGCTSDLSMVCTHNHCVCLLPEPGVFDLFKSSFRASRMVKRMKATQT